MRKGVSAMRLMRSGNRRRSPDNSFAYASDYFGISNFEKINIGELSAENINKGLYHLSRCLQALGFCISILRWEK